MPGHISKQLDIAILVGAVALAVVGGLYIFVEELRGQSVEVTRSAAAQSGDHALDFERDVLIKSQIIPSLKGASPTLGGLRSTAGGSVIALARQNRLVGIAVAYPTRTGQVLTFSDQDHAPIASEHIGSGAGIALVGEKTRQIRFHLDGAFVEELDLSGAALLAR